MTIRRLLELFMSGEITGELHTPGRVVGFRRDVDNQDEYITVTIATVYAGRSVLTGKTIDVAVTTEPEGLCYLVACRDDTDEEGTPGDYVLATRQAFPTAEAGREATRFIHPCRERIIIESPRGGFLRTAGIGGK